MSSRKNQRRLRNRPDVTVLRRDAANAARLLNGLHDPGAPRHEIDEAQLLHQDPIVKVFLGSYFGYAAAGQTVCTHLKQAANTSTTMVWDSANPSHLYCEHCNLTGIAFRLQVRGLLPTRCICLAPATRAVRVAAGGLIMICRVCDRCSQRPEQVVAQ